MRRLAAVLLALAAVVAAGCGGESVSTVGGGRVPGGTLTIVSILPREGPRAAAAEQVTLGIKVALAQAGGRIGDLALNYTALDAPARPEALATQVQLAVRDISCIAVISDLDETTARTTVPLLNAAGFLQVSPGVTDGALAREPALEPSGRRTFATLQPPQAAEAAALVRAATGSVAVEAESGDAAAEALAAAVRDRAGRTVPTARAGTVVYTGTDPENAAGALEGIARENRRARLLAPQALWGSGLAERLPRGVRRRLSFTTAVGGPADPEFIAAYRAAFGAAPDGPWAQVGWEAANRVLAALRAAGDRANVRQAVIDAFFAADPAAAAARRPFRVVPAA